MTKTVNPLTGNVKYTSLDGSEHERKEDADKVNDRLREASHKMDKDADK